MAIVDQEFGRDIDMCLEALNVRRWCVVAFSEPVSAVGAYLRLPTVVDVVVMWSEIAALSYRTPRRDGMDPFAPDHVVGSPYHGPSLWVLRWALSREPPGDELEPIFPVPPDFATSPVDREKRRVWLPKPGAANVDGGR